MVLFVFLSAAYRNGARVGVAAYERAAHDLRLRLVDRVLDPRGGGEGGRLPGELLSVATADVDAAAGIVRAVAFGVGVAVALLAGATVLLLTSVQLGLMVLVGLPLALWASHRLARPLTRRATEQQSTAADAAGVAADLVRATGCCTASAGPAPASPATARRAAPRWTRRSARRAPRRPTRRARCSWPGSRSRWSRSRAGGSRPRATSRSASSSRRWA